MAEPQTSAEYQQRRGVAWDIIDEAINNFDAWMRDDDYDATRKLFEIVNTMRERRALYHGTD